MNKEIKAKWVAALRSGEYKQTKGDLRSRSTAGAACDKFCCLGVLQEVLDDRDESISAKLPSLRVMNSIGLDLNDPAITHPRFKTLAAANDGGLTFSEIADIIEEQL